MKAKIIIITLVSMSFASTIQAQETDTTFMVNGVCGMCRNVIEKAALVEGVSQASWSVESRVITVTYDASKTSVEQISEAINASGYDTEFNTAPDEAYFGLHKCCYYRDPAVQEAH